MNGLLDNIIEHIIENGIAQGKAIDIYKDFMPDEQNSDVIININEYAGTGNADYTDMSVRSIQVLVRSADSALARTKAWDVFKVLCPPGLLLDIHSIKMISKSRSTPTKLSVDSKGRSTFFFNIAITTNND